MMDYEQYLLGKLAEECAEVGQRALKTAQFGMDEVQPGQALDNAERLHAELDDLMAIVELLNVHHGLNYTPNAARIAAKKAPAKKRAAKKAAKKRVG